MNRKISLLLCIFSFSIISSFAQGFRWAKDFTYSPNASLAIALDDSGNVYSAGTFNYVVDFDPGPDTNALVSAGLGDLYVTKMNAQGELVWARAMGGINAERAVSVKVDDNFNVYIAGMFEGTVDFDPGADTAELTSAGQEDIFICKLDAGGNYVWARQVGGSSGELTGSLLVDRDQQVVLAGSFTGSIDADPGTGTQTFSSAGSADILVLKLSASGNLVWARQMAGTETERAYSIAEHPSGTLYLTGSFRGTTDFDPGSGTANLSAFGDEDVFICKISAAGNYIWAKRIGGGSDEWGQSIAIDNLGNLLITGAFEGGNTDFDPGSGSHQVQGHGSPDVFVVKLDSNGNFRWVRDFGLWYLDYGMSVAVDQHGNSYTTGQYELEVDLNTGPDTMISASLGETDVFILKLDSAGNFVWAKSLGGEYFDVGYGIAADNNENVFISGHFAAEADLDPGRGTYIRNTGSILQSHSFILKLGSCSNSSSGISRSACLSYTSPSGKTFSSSGMYTDTIANHRGCDSVISINLSILEHSYALISASACSVYNSPGGKKLTSSGIYSDTIVNHAGCDSIITINLSILRSFSTISRSGCQYYTSPSGKLFFSGGNYKDTIPNAAGCDSIISINLTVIKPDTSVSRSGNTFTANANGVSYKWVDCNNNFAAISGQTAKSFTPTANGSYAVVITQSSCSDTSFCHQISSVGIKEADGQLFRLYPNPSAGQIHLESTSPARMEIFDLYGRLVFETEVESGQSSFDLAHFAQGVYYLQLSGKAVGRQKLLIVR